MTTLKHLAHLDEESLHTALLLSFVQAVYGTVRTLASPSPLYRLSYDEKTSQIDLTETGGSSYVPRAATMDISDLDILMISNLRDIPVLLEGETGTGKTYISQAYLRAVFPPESSISLRLSGSTFLNNVFQPFLEGRIEQGLPVTRIKPSAVDSIAALFIDEINRGDPQSILQLLDNELFNGGVFTKLGLPVPHLRNGAPDRRKKLFIVSAQNPAATTEAKFTGTIELDAAVDNRLLKITFGNAARSVGSTLWLTEDVHKPFDAFLAEFGTLASGYLGIDASLFNDLKKDWLPLYAWVTDSSRTDKPVLYSALELTDFLTTILGGDLPEKHAYELGVIREWCSALHAKVELGEPVKVTEKVKKIHEIVATFKVPVIFRDIVQIKKLADVLSTLQSVREALAHPTPVEAYRTLEKVVSVREIAGATALLARSKQLPKSPPATPVVNEVMVQYTTLTEKYLHDVGYMPARFNRCDPNLGIKRLAIARAARETIRASGSASDFAKHLVAEAKRLLKHQSATEEIENILISKAVADLLTLGGFLIENADGLASAMKASTDAELVRGIAQFYLARRKSHAAILPDIFQHRIQRTLGV